MNNRCGLASTKIPNHSDSVIKQQSYGFPASWFFPFSLTEVVLRAMASCEKVPKPPSPKIAYSAKHVLRHHGSTQGFNLFFQVAMVLLLTSGKKARRQSETASKGR